VVADAVESARLADVARVFHATEFDGYYATAGETVATHISSAPSAISRAGWK
jgi:hypothetical protein